MTTAALPAPSTVQMVELPAPLPDDVKRMNDIKTKRWPAFRGDLPKPLKVLDPNAPDFNVMDNRCCPVVLKGVSFLFGQPIDVDVKLTEGPTENEGELEPDVGDAGAAPGDEGATDKAQDWLDDALGDIDDFMTLLSEAAINGGVTGMSFIKLLPANPKAGFAYPRFVVLDPETVWVETDPDDCRLVQAFNIQYTIPATAKTPEFTRRQRISRSDPDQQAPIYNDDDADDTWTIQNYIQYTKSNAEDRWLPVGEPITWDYRFPPIVYCQNLPQPNEFWGMPDLTDDLIAMNNQLNLIQSNINKLLWFYGHPYIFIDSPDVGKLQVTPGVVVGIGQGVKVTAIQATGDIANARAFGADLRSDMDELSRVPAVALGRLTELPRGNISGVALALLFQPLLEKTQIKRRLYGRMIRDLCQRCLALGGFGDGESQPVEIHWPEMMPVDELQTLQALLIKQQLGVSDHTIFGEMNLDYDEEKALKASEQEDQQSSFDAGQGLNPAANQFGKTALPPEMQQMQQAMQNVGGAK